MRTTVVTPKIEDGPASVYMKMVAAAGIVVAAVTAVLEGDYTAETISAGVVAALALATYARGKYQQATALIARDAPVAPSEPLR